MGPLGFLRAGRSHIDPVLQVVVGPQVYHLVQRPYFGVPEAAQFGVLLPVGQPLAEDLLVARRGS